MCDRESKEVRSGGGIESAMERLAMQVPVEFSANYIGNFEAGMALQSHPDLVLGNWSFYIHVDS